MPAAAALWLSLTVTSPVFGVQAVAATAQGADRTDTLGVVVGTVRVDGFGPVVFANVIVMGSKQGTITDAKGGFLVTSLVPGSHVLDVQAVGFHKVSRSVVVRAGETTRVEVAFPASPPDSRVPDKALTKRIRKTSAMGVYRIGPEWRENPGPRAIRNYTVVREAWPGKRWRARLIDLLEQPTSYRSAPIPPGWPEPKKLCGGFEPGLAVRFSSPADTIDLLVCYKCAQFALLANPKNGHGDFDLEKRTFIELGQEAFSDDEDLRAISPQ